MLELAASEVSFGPVESSVFAITPPAERQGAGNHASPKATAKARRTPTRSGERPKVTTHGHGPATIAVLESEVDAGEAAHRAKSLEGLPKVTIDGASASELRTELGTLLTFERSGVRYLLAGCGRSRSRRRSRPGPLA